MILNNLKLGTKILIAPMIMAIMFSYVSLQTYTMLQIAQTESTEITGNLKNTAKEATTLLQAISDKLLAITQYITAFDDDDYLQVYEIRTFEAAASIRALAKLKHDSHQMKILEKIKFYNKSLDTAFKNAVDGESLLEDQESVLALKLIGFNAEQAALHLQANVWQSMDILAADIEKQLSDTTMAVISVGLGAIVVGILIAFIVTISITGPIKRMVKAMQNIADGEGDLTQKLEVNGSDEVALLAAGFNRFSESIRVIVQGVLESTVKLTMAADELKQHSNNAHNNIHVQGKQTENVDTAVNNMNATAHEIAGNTITATEAVQVAETAANDSLKQMSDTVISINELASAVEETSQSMMRLEEGSNNIGTVVDVIRGVAEQTNLLALNAAIEAARAGEHGRGFAVVADEVRTLANRTQTSTDEIQNMIEALQIDASAASVLMKQGKDLACASVDRVHQASDSLNSVSDSVDIMHNLNNQIATSAEQQSQVTTEVSSNIHSIKTMAINSVTEMGHATDVSEKVNLLANELKNQISRFKTA